MPVALSAQSRQYRLIAGRTKFDQLTDGGNRGRWVKYNLTLKKGVIIKAIQKMELAD
jgi:hypothetical protein